jgi:hypothetical protein
MPIATRKTAGERLRLSHRVCPIALGVTPTRPTARNKSPLAEWRLSILLAQAFLEMSAWRDFAPGNHFDLGFCFYIAHINCSFAPVALKT